MTRSQYITVLELQGIFGVGNYPDNPETLRMINEASEDIDYITLKKSMEYNEITAFDLLKLATAYQVEYRRQNSDLDNEFDIGNGFNLGRYSEQGTGGQMPNQEFKRISPRTRQYLLKAGMLNRAIG